MDRKSHHSTKDLYAFGYGVSLIIPFLVWMHQMARGIPVIAFGGLLIVLLGLIIVVQRLKPWWNLWIIFVQVYVLSVGLNQGILGLSTLWLSLSMGILVLTVMEVKFLRPVYSAWMKIVSLISGFIAMITLSIVFYIVFGIPGVILRVLKKDLLNESSDPRKKSYWIKRPTDVKQNYENQF